MRLAISCAATLMLLHCSDWHYFADNQSFFRHLPVQKGPKMLYSIMRFLRSWRRYNISLRQLSHLNDRELADIGISRSDIPRVALDAAKI